MKHEIFDDLFVLELANNHWGDVRRGPLPPQSKRLERRVNAAGRFADIATGDHERNIPFR